MTATATGDHHPSEKTRAGTRTRLVAITLVAAGLVAIATSVGLAHADDTSTPPSSVATGAATGAVAGAVAGAQVAASTEIGLVSITQKTTTGALVENSVIQIERRPDIPDSSSTTPATTEPASTEATSSASAASQPASTSAVGAATASAASVAVPVGVAFDVVTGKAPVILALPAGIYKLTHLGTVGATNAPNAGDVTIRVAAGAHVAGNLLEQPGTTRGAAPGITAATPTSPTPVPVPAN